MKTEHSLFAYKESKILILGLSLLGLFFILVLLSSLLFPTYLQPILSITATNIIFGRMAGLSIGIASQIDITLLIFFNLFIESIMVLILYPLFVLSWRKLDLISYKPLSNFLNKSKQSAVKYKPLIKQYGVVGLLLFVITPFAMTGPVVGSFIGFLIGFNHLKTLSVVLFSTLIAITIWVYLIKNFEAVLIEYNDTIITGFTVIALFLLLWYLVKKYLLVSN